MKQYTDELHKLQLGSGFFEGWPHAPSEEMHRTILKRSYLAFVAIDTDHNQIVGFINAVSDGVLSAPTSGSFASLPQQGDWGSFG